MRCIIDIKTGKAMPWTRLQLSAYHILDKDVEFDEEHHKYGDGKYESVTGILKSEGFIDERFYNDFARERGTFVHLAVHLDIMDDLRESTLDDDIRPYLSAWRDFRKTSGIKNIVSEKHMISTMYQYAGTPDIICDFDGAVTDRYALELTPKKFNLKEYKDYTDHQRWIWILSNHNWKKNNMRRQEWTYR